MLTRAAATTSTPRGRALPNLSPGALSASPSCAPRADNCLLAFPARAHERIESPVSASLRQPPPAAPRGAVSAGRRADRRELAENRMAALECPTASSRRSRMKITNGSRRPTSVTRPQLLTPPKRTSTPMLHRCDDGWRIDLGRPVGCNTRDNSPCSRVILQTNPRISRPDGLMDRVVDIPPTLYCLDVTVDRGKVGAHRHNGYVASSSFTPRRNVFGPLVVPAAILLYRLEAECINISA